MRSRWSILCALVSMALLVNCLPDSDKPPVPGGPPDNPYSVSRKGGNGRHGLDHHLILFGIAPTQGPTAGGNDVLIVGFNFHQAGPVTEVLFGTEPALSFIVQSNNQIDALTPPQGRGLVGVTVRNDIGEEATLDDIYEYVAPPPACLTLTPTSGPDTGGTDVTIETANFFDDFTLDLPDVYFDTALALSVTPLDATTLLVVTPPDPNPLPSPGIRAVDVTVVSASGQDSCVFPQGYTYFRLGAPNCISLDPTSGPSSGGAPVTIVTSGFADDFTVNQPTVWFDTTPALVVSAISATTIVVTTPADPNPGPSGVHPVDVTVQSTGIVESCVFPQGYTYITPTGACMRINPSCGPVAGGNTVTITSLGPCYWTGNTTVTFDGVFAMFTFSSSSEIVVVVPPGAGPGPVDVEVTGADGQGNPCSCLLPDGYSYGCCSITGITPDQGGTNGGTIVTISGTGFDVGVDVLFGGYYCDPRKIVVDPTSSTITCVAPPSPIGGPVDVEVRSAFGVSCIVPDAYSYILPGGGLCSITSLFPAQGPTSGGTTVTITGAGFDGNTGVLFGWRPATQVIFINTNTLEVVTPPASAPGAVDVVVAPETSNPCVMSGGFYYQ